MGYSRSLLESGAQVKDFHKSYDQRSLWVSSGFLKVSTLRWGSAGPRIKESTAPHRAMSDLNVNASARTYAGAVAALKAAESAKRDAANALLAAMQSADLTSASTPAGKVSVCAGRRTVKITCKALSAEIKLMQERAVRTGRATESVGDPYVMLR